MKTNHEQFINRRRSERGNALIYVLIAVVLFAALSMVLGRQTDTSESGAISEDKAELLAAQMISYAVQAKSVADQMVLTGRPTAIDDMDFTRPNAAGFNTAPHVDKIYHPQGGGLIPARMAPEMIGGTLSDLAPGWYLGRFNNVEWTATAGNDVILAAYEVNPTVCGKINEKITGSTTIPALTAGKTLRNMFIDDALHAGANEELNTADCAGCGEYFSLCVSNPGVTRYTFYNIIAAQ